MRVFWILPFARRFDLLDMLLEWGADLRRVSLADLFDSYNSGLNGQAAPHATTRCAASSNRFLGDFSLPPLRQRRVGCAARKNLVYVSRGG
jgi:hypothetical protein